MSGNKTVELNTYKMRSGNLEGQCLALSRVNKREYHESYLSHMKKRGSLC